MGLLWSYGYTWSDGFPWSDSVVEGALLWGSGTASINDWLEQE